MNTIKYFKLFLKYTLYLLFAILVMSQGCSDEDNPAEPKGEHFEPEGWMVRDAAMKPVLVVWQGTIQRGWNGFDVSDTLYAPLNILSDQHTVKFLDSGRNIINPPEEEDHSFGWSISDTSVIMMERDAPGDWEFKITGKKPGTTTVELQVLHNGHVDVRTPLIPVQTVPTALNSINTTNIENESGRKSNEYFSVSSKKTKY